MPISMLIAILSAWYDENGDILCVNPGDVAVTVQLLRDTDNAPLVVFE